MVAIGLGIPLLLLVQVLAVRTQQKTALINFPPVGEKSKLPHGGSHYSVQTTS